MAKVMGFKDRIDPNGVPPSERLGYLSPSSGSFTLDGRQGFASFVWYHGEDLVVDWHSHALTFVGTLTSGRGVVFWGYKVAGHDDAGAAGEHEHEALTFFFASERTNSDQAF